MPTHNLSDACSVLQKVVPLVIADFNAANEGSYYAAVGQVLRSTAEQQALYAKGRTVPPLGERYYVTMRDGVNLLSNHQAMQKHGEMCSHATDINIFTVDGKYVGTDPMYRELIPLALKYDVKSGGDWNRNGIAADIDHDYFPDFPHLECLGVLPTITT